MRDLLRYLLADTVEAHVSPARYRLEKVAHVTLLGAIGWPLLGAQSVLVAGLLYFTAGLVPVIRASTYRPDDKLRDCALCCLPGFVALGWWWLVAASLAVNVALVRVRD